MKTYLIIYQLSVAESAYANLIAYIKTATYWAKPFNSAWLIKTDVDVAKIRDGLRERIGPNDKIIVIEVPNKNWGSYNISAEVTKWMHNNI